MLFYYDDDDAAESPLLTGFEYTYGHFLLKSLPHGGIDRSTVISYSLSLRSCVV